MTAGEIDKSKRRLLTTATTIAGGAAVVATAIPFIKGMLPSEGAKVAGGAVGIKLEKVEPEKVITIKWRGRPIWILHRSQLILANLERLNSQLRDPFSEVELQQPPYARNLWRSIKPDNFQISLYPRTVIREITKLLLEWINRNLSK